MKNHIFWSEIGSGFWEPCGTPPPKMLGSTPRGWLTFWALGLRQSKKQVCYPYRFSHRQNISSVLLTIQFSGWWGWCWNKLGTEAVFKDRYSAKWWASSSSSNPVLWKQLIFAWFYDDTPNLNSTSQNSIQLIPFNKNKNIPISNTLYPPTLKCFFFSNRSCW